MFLNCVNGKYQLILFLFVLSSFVHSAWADTDYWSTIKGHYLDKSDGARERLREYVGSLSEEELITAGRQASMEAEKICLEYVLCEGSYGTLDFFYMQYLKVNVSSRTDNLLREIKDKTQTNFWRTSLIHYLGSRRWRKIITEKQLHDVVADAISGIVDDGVTTLEFIGTF